MDILVLFSSGHISRENDNVNSERADEIGLFIQRNHDNLTYYTDTMQTKNKVKPLSVLEKTVKMKEKTLYIDTMKLFTRLMVIGERELSIKESFCYELTPLPTSFFTNGQKMRKTNKAVLGNKLKKMLKVQVSLLTTFSLQ